jgi:hypothetical protein
MKRNGCSRTGGDGYFLDFAFTFFTGDVLRVGLTGVNSLRPVACRTTAKALSLAVVRRLERAVFFADGLGMP